MHHKLARVKARLQEIDDLDSAIAVLRWDQSTYMPEGGAPARGRQLATLGRLAHDRRIDPALGDLLQELSQPGALPEGSVDAAVVRVARRAHDRAVRVPAELIERILENGAASYQAWTRAKPEDDFSLVKDTLARSVELSREMASHQPNQGHLADPLISHADTGFTVDGVRALFAELRRELTPLVEAACDRPAEDDAWMRQPFDPKAQLDLSAEIARKLGYAFERGRLDLTHHPYMTKFSLGDVRITTKVRPDDLVDTLFSTIHETGHALYEQGIDPQFEGTPLADGASFGIHESQSRLWENIIGRSRPFCAWILPRLQEVFPAQLAGVDAERFYRGVNTVKRSLIRTEADELTYNLHVIIRFDLEMALLEGDLTVADLPGAWRERYRKDLGLDPGCDRLGVLQDVHWYDGVVGGMFQGYTIGNVLSAQFYDAALAARPGLTGEIARGEFAGLRAWLQEAVHQHGQRYDAPDVIQRATGRPIEIGPYVRYLKAKYGELCGVG